MRVVIRFAIVAGLLLGVQGCASDRSHSLVGTWELIDARYTPPDPAFVLGEWRQIKVITSTHWVYMSQKRTAPKITSFTNDAELLAVAKGFGAGGGRYTLNGDTYTEHIEFFMAPNYLDRAVSFKVKWEGDEWIQSGTFPMKELGLAAQDMELYERYRRVK
jgi:hypothetical protein